MALCLYQMLLFTLGMCRIDRAKQGRRIVVFYRMFQEFAAVYCILYMLLGGSRGNTVSPLNGFSLGEICGFYGNLFSKGINFQGK